MHDFTLKKYGEILDSIIAQGLPVHGVLSWCKQPTAKGVLLRHDVDRWPKNALAMAKMEALKGIQSTYYFRIGKATFKPDIIREIAAFGHEIGYHYEDLSLCGGDVKKGLVLFEAHLKLLREIATVKTIAMHGRPLSPFDNRDLWKHADIRDYQLEAEAFLNVDYGDVYYFTDTGRSWNEAAVNLRDKVRTRLSENIDGSDSLIDFISNHPDAKVSLVAHPERWNDSFLKWHVYRVLDMMVNRIKYVIHFVYSRR